MKTATRQFIWDKTDGRCFYCGHPLCSDEVEFIVRAGPGSYQSWMEIDHLHPRSKGGLDAVDNMIPSCQACNCSKSNKTLEEYRHAIALRRAGWPKLSNEIVEWLTTHKFDFPALPSHKFWFEENGLSVELDISRHELPPTTAA